MQQTGPPEKSNPAPNQLELRFLHRKINSPGSFLSNMLIKNR